MQELYARFVELQREIDTGRNPDSQLQECVKAITQRTQASKTAFFPVTFLHSSDHLFVDLVLSCDAIRCIDFNGFWDLSGMMPMLTHRISQLNQLERIALEEQFDEETHADVLALVASLPKESLLALDLTQNCISAR
ncbi:hypothetical protein HDU91_002352, partial [Kappamyces sp. JEL0680]